MRERLEPSIEDVIAAAGIEVQEVPTLTHAIAIPWGDRPPLFLLPAFQSRAARQRDLHALLMQGMLAVLDGASVAASVRDAYHYATRFSSSVLVGGLLAGLVCGGVLN